MALSRLVNVDSGTMVGLLTAAGVYLIYNNALPNAADIRVSQPHDQDVETERKHAAWKSVALVGIVFLVSRDLNSYIISGASLVGIDLMYKHANAVHPATGKIDTTSSDGSSIAPSLSGAYPMPDYSQDVAS